MTNLEGIAIALAGMLYYSVCSVITLINQKDGNKTEKTPLNVAAIIVILGAGAAGWASQAITVWFFHFVGGL